MGLFKDKVAVVTGASRGIGRAIVRMLAQEGCQVAFNYHQSDAAAAAFQDELQKVGHKVKASRVDIKDFAEVRAWIEETRNHFGRIDILVNNAGIIVDKALMLMSQEDWDVVLSTNLDGYFHAARACIVTFLKQKSGDIVNISSVSGSMGLPRQVNYSAAKGGVNAFTKALAKEVAAYGVRVNAVAPGYIDTEILSGFNEEQRAKIIESIPLNHLGTPQDVVNCVRFLLSPSAQYITGQVITVDGGLTMR